MTIKIVSLNVKGLNSPYKPQMAWKEAKNLHCDVICFQETHFAATKSPTFQNRQFPHIFQANYSSKKGELQ